MNPFEMVVLIVAIVMIASVAKARYRRDPDAAPHDDPARRAEIDRLTAELGALKERVAMLERIATDGTSALDRQIEALRDRT